MTTANPRPSPPRRAGPRPLRLVALALSLALALAACGGGGGEWIARGENANEPWVFLVGADGTSTARWDNVATRPEIEPFLQQLPRMPGA